MLQPRDSSEYLSHLVCLGHPFVILDIYTRIALPGHTVDAVAGALLPCRPEVAIALPAQVRKPYSPRVGSHLPQNVIDAGHIQMVSLLILYVK